MLQNIIKNRRGGDVTLKIVYGSEIEADEALSMLEEHKDENEKALEKMRLLYHLKDIQLATVTNNVFIIYHFLGGKEAKDFEISFTRNIKDDGSNLFESFLIAQKEPSEKDEEQFKIKLKLPQSAIKALNEFSGIQSVTMEGEPSCPIYRDMIFYNGKNVKLTDTDFEKSIVSMITIYNGSKTTRAVPQKWLDIEEVRYKAIVNAQWALNPKNIVAMQDGSIVSMFAEKEIFTPMEIIKMDGLTITLLKREGGYLEPSSGLIFLPEHIIMK